MVPLDTDLVISVDLGTMLGTVSLTIVSLTIVSLTIVSLTIVSLTIDSFTTTGTTISFTITTGSSSDLTSLRLVFLIGGTPTTTTTDTLTITPPMITRP